MKAPEHASTPKSELPERRLRLRKAFLIRIQRRGSLVGSKKDLGCDLEESYSTMGGGEEIKIGVDYFNL